MHLQVGKGLLFLLLAGIVTTVTPQEMPQSNITKPDFPFMTPDLKEMAKKLMLKCSEMGYYPVAIAESPYSSSVDVNEMVPRNPISFFPSLLSSLPHPPSLSVDLTSPRMAHPPNSSMAIPDRDTNWNVTEKLWNVTTLPDMIDIMKNSTDQPRCFMQAFIAPVAWHTVTHSGPQLRLEDLGKLLWAAKPFLQNMPPNYIDLPSHLDQPHLVQMMKMFSDVFSSLSEEQRDQIRDWVKARVLENEYGCASKNTAWEPNGPLPWTIGASTPVKPGPLLQLTNVILMKSGGSKLVRCSPRHPWLNRAVLKIMGRFLSRLPPQEVEVISSNELCEFFRSPDFPFSFQGVGAIQASLGRTLMRRLKQCFLNEQEFLQHTASLMSLGSLVCFYDGEAQSLNKTTSKHLLAQLNECQNSATNKLKQQLVRNLLSMGKTIPGPEFLESLGSDVSVLPPSKLVHFSTQALANTLPSLSKASWSAAQAKTLAEALLTKKKNISSSSLLSLGTLVRGVSSSMLRNVRGSELLKAEEKERLESVSQEMTLLQRKALLKGMRSDVNVSQLVMSVPASLLSSMSLSTLQRAQLTSVDQLEGRNWTRAQSAYLLKKLLVQRLTPSHLRKLGRAIQGVTCEMIDSLSQNDTIEGIQALSQSSGWLSKTQIGCAARKLFDRLEEVRGDYFSAINEAELKSIPAMLLIHLPAQKIKELPATVCGAFLEKMRAVNFSCLSNSSPSPAALTKRALDCLGKNMSDVSAMDLWALGSLLCELAPPQLRSLAPEVLNSTLLALASCPYIRRQHRAELWSMVTASFGDPSIWSEKEMQSLGRFLLLDGVALKTLADKPWLRPFLSDLMDSLPVQPSGPVPEEFHLLPDLLALRWKLFVLNTRESSVPTQRRRKRETLAVGTPTSELIKQLGEDNVFWSPAQLANMSSETFTQSASQLGEIRNFTAEQLAALGQKVKELWGPVAQLNESQVVELGCVSQAFSAQELLQLNMSALDTLELLATCKWTQAQRRAVWQGFTEHVGLSAAQLGELEMVGLGQFICGLAPNEVQLLNNDSFREAAEAMGCHPCELPQLERLKKKAVGVFGEPQSWNEGQVMALGNIVAGLDATELQSLKASVFSFIVSSAIPLIPPKTLAALPVSQLRALGPDNAAMVTDAQKVELNAEQKMALSRVVANTRAEDTSSGGSVSGGGSPSGANAQQSAPVPQTGGSASHNMEGFGILLKPLLCLLLGFMF